MRLSKHLLSLATVIGMQCSLSADAIAQGKPCRQGLKGVYVTWSKSSTTTGLGRFEPGSGRASVLPGFSWEITGEPRTISVATNEPFSGGNSMKGFYGPGEDATNLNVRIEPNNVGAGAPIPHSALLTIRFDAGTPASGWGFAVVDIDVDQVKFRAKDTAGVAVPSATIARWFVQRFDANPPTDGVNIPSWDSQNVAVVGSESSSITLRSNVEGGLTDTEAGSAWFQPNVSLSELSFEYQSLQESATPSYHVFIAACSTTFVSPTPTPFVGGDSDGDTIPDATEGSGDPDNDDMPNYLDRDSDNDTILDSTEGTSDPDSDGNPNFTDLDSDGDDVPDIIERDPDASGNPATGKDDDRDGIDDGSSSRTNEPVDDSDTDSIPDYLDQDSDNDGKDDGDEAFDLDGDGQRDIQPSGKDDDDNGIDDAFEAFDSADDVNSHFSGDSSESLCQVIAVKKIKKNVEKRLTALVNRVPMFAKRAAACRATVPAGLVSGALLNKRIFEQSLSAAFPDRGLVCPASVCTLTNTKNDRSALQALAKKLYQDAKKAKLLTIAACGSSPEKPTVRRPTTETYAAQLRSEINKLPKQLSKCE
jgi:hypothetical protein